MRIRVLESMRDYYSIRGCSKSVGVYLRVVHSYQRALESSTVVKGAFVESYQRVLQSIRKYSEVIADCESSREQKRLIGEQQRVAETCQIVAESSREDQKKQSYQKVVEINKRGILANAFWYSLLILEKLSTTLYYVCCWVVNVSRPALIAFPVCAQH